jgi:hypothetical protein
VAAPEFRAVMLEERRDRLDADRLEAEVLAVIDGPARRTPELGALIIERTDLVEVRPADSATTEHPGLQIRHADELGTCRADPAPLLLANRSC